MVLRLTLTTGTSDSGGRIASYLALEGSLQLLVGLGQLLLVLSLVGLLGLLNDILLVLVGRGGCAGIDGADGSGRRCCEVSHCGWVGGPARRVGQSNSGAIEPQADGLLRREGEGEGRGGERMGRGGGQSGREGGREGEGEAEAKREAKGEGKGEGEDEDEDESQRTAELQ